MAFSFIIDGIDSESQELVNMYLEENKKSDIRDINYNDYLLYIKPFENSLNGKTPSKLKLGFIKYLYAFDFLKDKSGFDNEYWNPTETIENFKKVKIEREEEKYKAALSFEQIEKIQQFLAHISEDNFDSIKLDLAFYMCFYEDIDNIKQLIQADAANYKDGVWTINNNDYNIPKKYERYLLHIQSLKKSKFYGLNSYIKQLGEQVGIKDLQPKHINKAREQMQVPCFECGKKYFVFKDYWSSINGKIVCNPCAAKILDSSDVKKNCISNELQCYEVDILTSQEKLNTEIATNSFEALRKKAPKTVDYRKLNEFLSYVGGLGEKYVYENEKKYLSNTEYWDMIDHTPSLNHENGYDILSYEKDGTSVMIEVKTTTGNKSDSFFITNRELNTAKRAWSENKKYKIYRVSNILAEDTSEISVKVYEELSEEDFDITGVVYKIKEKVSTNF